MSQILPNPPTCNSPIKPPTRRDYLQILIIFIDGIFLLLTFYWHRVVNVRKPDSSLALSFDVTSQSITRCPVDSPGSVIFLMRWTFCAYQCPFLVPSLRISTRCPEFNFIFFYLNHNEDEELNKVNFNFNREKLTKLLTYLYLYPV